MCYVRTKLKDKLKDSCDIGQYISLEQYNQAMIRRCSLSRMHLHIAHWIQCNEEAAFIIMSILYLYIIYRINEEKFKFMKCEL